MNPHTFYMAPISTSPMVPDPASHTDILLSSSKPGSSGGQPRAGRCPTSDPGSSTADRADPASGPQMTATGRDRGSKRDRLRQSHDAFDTLFSCAPPFTRFYTLRSTNNADISKLNPFKVDRELRRRIDDPARISFNTDKTITVEVKSAQLGQNLSALHTLLSEPITVSVHQRYNSSQGVISCSLIKDLSEEEIVDGLSDVGVIRAHCIKRRTPAGSYEPTATLVLTFNVSTPPDRIRLIAGLQDRVRPYVLLPKRCYRCQHYGHLTKNCRRQTAICGRCGSDSSDTHKPEECQRLVYCYHCHEPHATSARTCPRYLVEKEIIALTVKEHLSFREARRIVSENYIRPNATFASVARSERPDSRPPSRGAPGGSASGNSLEPLVPRPTRGPLPAPSPTSAHPNRPEPQLPSRAAPRSAPASTATAPAPSASYTLQTPVPSPPRSPPRNKRLASSPTSRAASKHPKSPEEEGSLSLSGITSRSMEELPHLPKGFRAQTSNLVYLTPDSDRIDDDDRPPPHPPPTSSSSTSKTRRSSLSRAASL